MVIKSRGKMELHSLVSANRVGDGGGRLKDQNEQVWDLYCAASADARVPGFTLPTFCVRTP